MDSTMVEVTQADRDAAGPFANCLSDMQDIFDGKADGLPVVQAFARHRIQSEGRTGAGEALREALEKIVGENGPVVIDHMAYPSIGKLVWRPLDYGTWTALAGEDGA